jgi:hypothetical protein
VDRGFGVGWVGGPRPNNISSRPCALPMSLANVQFRGRSPVFSLPCTRHHHQADQALDTRRQRGPPCPLQQPPRRSNLQAQNKCRNEINWPLGVSRSVRERMPASDPWALLQPMLLSPCPARQHLVLRAVSLLSAHHAAVFSFFLSSHRSCFLSLFAPIEQLTPQLCFLSPNL